MPFDPFGFGRQLAEIRGQLSQLFSLVQKQGRLTMSGLTDLQTQVSNLVATNSNETAAINACIAAITNELAILQNPSSDDAAEEAAAQSIAAQLALMQTSTANLSAATAQLPPVSTITPPPAPAPAPAA